MNQQFRSKIARWFYLFLGGLVSLIAIAFGLLRADLLAFQSPQTEVFQAAWQTVNQEFFDPNFNGVDWSAMREKYRPQIAQAPSSEAAAIVINQMLAELQTSHTHLYTPDEPAYYQLLGIFFPRSPELRRELEPQLPGGELQYSGIGIFTQTSDGKTFVSGILEGSPAADTDLQVGDQILSVEGQPFQPIQSFANRAGQTVQLLVQHSPDPGSQQAIAVMPKWLDPLTLFLEAQQASVQVLEREGKKVGYVHIWSYAGDQYQQQLEQDLLYGPLSEADTLVLDLRDGWGGAPLTALNIYTASPLSVTNVQRDGTRYTSTSRWGKPVVMLVNGGSRSAKEILAYGFQQFGIGPVVGTTTAGAVVAGRPFVMPDRSLLYVAVADVYVNGEIRLEGQGVLPDVVVPFSLPYAQGADPQKDRAIAIALEAA